MAKVLSIRYHAKTALGSMLGRHSEQWRSKCKNIPATLGMAELTSLVVESHEIDLTTPKVIDTAANTRLSASWYASVIR